MVTENNDKFVFLPYQIEENKKIVFKYQLTHQGTQFLFQEKIDLPKTISQTINQHLLDKILNNLSLILGISYWKTFCPKKIILSHYQLTKEQVDFWNTIYTKGLGEFFYKNEIDFRNLINFPLSNKKQANNQSIKIKNPSSSIDHQQSLLGFGGGKDSIVAAEILKKRGAKFSLFVLYHQTKPKIIIDGVKIVNKPTFWIKRTIDLQLFQLNKKKGVYNGHIPFNAIISFIALLVATLYGFNEIVTANEKDANEGNLFYLNEEINHQWSKSKEYETLFNQYLKKFISTDIRYYSLLRDMDELKIAKEFSQHPQYFFHFSSCNQNFKIKNSLQISRWCGHCPKCLFTYLILAPFIEKKTMIKIFKDNLLQKKELSDLYQQLLGLKNHKPFECVGAKKTVINVSKKLAKMKDYQNDYLIKFFKEKYAI